MRPSDLNRERWRRIDEVLGAALETPLPQRDAFLTDACRGDEALRSEVEALLDAHRRAGDRFDEPVSPLAAALLAARDPPPVDRMVGRFRLHRELGRGGMGVVYLAEDTRLGRLVALKALPPYLGVGREAKQRFIAEARAVSALDHPNIATLHEIDETDDGQLFMVFAYYRGETLADRIARGPLPPDEALDIATDIARGLEAAHQQGITHRDVKPSNVLLTDRGEVKLLDFGVAKVAGEDVTREGVRLGTLAYMSPEQVDGGPVDARTDLWSLGVVLCEMLTGERPFAADDIVSLARAIRNDEPAVPSVSGQGAGAAALTSTIARLLAGDPTERYASATDLLRDLREIQAGGSVARAVVTRGRSRSKIRLSGARAWLFLIAATVTAGGIWLAPRIGGGGNRRLAVLPLENRTGSPNQDPFVDGVHEAIVGELGRIDGLGVISRTSVSRYRDAGMGIPDIARELAVDALVEGSVSRHGDSLSVSMRLIGVSPERQLWTGTFSGPIADIYALAGDAALSIAGGAGVSIGPEEAGRLVADRPVDPAAYDAFTLGVFHVEQRSRESFELADRYFRQAIEIDPDFARPYAGLAEARGSAGFFGLERPSVFMPETRRLARTALRLDSTLAAAHRLLALVSLYGDWDWAAAERQARTAIRLSPGEASPYRSLAEVLSVLGRYDEALEAVEHASELDRFVPFSVFRPVVVLYYMRDFDRAVESAEEGLRFFTNFWQGHWLLCQSLAGEERYQRAIDACQKAVELSDGGALAVGELARVSALSGRRSDAERMLDGLVRRADTTYVPASGIAAIYASLGEMDRTFEWLDRAYEERDIGLVHIDDDAAFDPARSDPRFAALLDRVGM